MDGLRTQISQSLKNSRFFHISLKPQHLTRLTLDLADQILVVQDSTDLSVYHELKQLTTLTLCLGRLTVTNLSILSKLERLSTLTLYLGAIDDYRVLTLDIQTLLTSAHKNHSKPDK